MNCINIDLGKLHLQVCELGENGELWEKRIRTDRDRIVEVFTARARGRVLLEACTDSEWVARLLDMLGYEMIIADPNYAPMYGQRNRRVKTDRRDALALAQVCRIGAYRPAHRLTRDVTSRAVGQSETTSYGRGLDGLSWRATAAGTPTASRRDSVNSRFPNTCIKKKARRCRLS